MKTRFRTTLSVIATFAVLALVTPASLHAQVYAIRDLGTLGGATSAAYNINANGQVVGESRNAAGELRPFLYSNGVLSDLGSLGGTIGYARGINDFGIVVGTSYTADGHPHAFLSWGGVMFDMHRLLLGGVYSMASDINNANQLAGSSGLATSVNPRHAYVLTGTDVIDFGTLGGTTSDAYAINASGMICGGGYIGGDLVERACISRGNSLFDITSLGGQYGVAYDINDANVVVGKAQLASGIFRPFIWVDQNEGPFGMIDLGTFGGAQGRADGINNHTQVVGAAQDASGAFRAFYWSQPTGLSDLNTWLPVGSGWVLTEAHALNDSGQIVGEGFHGGQQHAFLLSPIALKSFTISPSVVLGGKSAFGTLTLSDVTPTDIIVTLASANPKVSAPASVRIPAGTSSAAFSLSTLPTGVATTGSVTATYNGLTLSASLTVRPPHIFSLALSPTAVRGGTPVTGTVVLEAAPAVRTLVTLSSNNPNVAQPAVSSIVINPSSRIGTFIVNTRVIALKALSATISASANGSTKSALLRVNP